MSLISENSLEKKKSSELSSSAVVMMIIGIIFVATNMRAPLTSVGPLVSLIRDNMHISNTLAGMITTLPLLAFALFSPFVPTIGRKVGVERLILAAIIFLTVGIILRSLGGATFLYVGTAILGLSIAICNVLLPSQIKERFPLRIGIMTGVYAISMNLFGAIGSGISVPIAVGLDWGWQISLGIWSILSFISVLFWLPQLKHRKLQVKHSGQQTQAKSVNLWKSSLAWQVTLFMGLQSMIFYVIITWLPEILKQQGIGSDQSGWLLSLMQLAVLPFTFIVPVIAGRMTSQRLLVVITAIFLIAATFGLLYGGYGLTIASIILLGIGVGFAFSIAMMFFSLRTENAQQAAELSGMAQSVGYLLAAIGPMLFGLLHDVTHSWTIPLLILIGASFLLLVFGLGAARNRHIGSVKQ